LNPAQMSAAVGLACSTASGTKSFAAGSGGGMMKRMHAGRAAEAGVRMAQLASRDFTAPPTALDGRFGLLEAFSGDTARPEQLAIELGQRWAVTQVFVKVYPVCSWIQATVQQLVALRGPEPLAVAQVRSVRIGVNAYAIRSNGEPTPPDTMGAQYSIPYCAALALTANPSDPLMYAPEAIADVSRRDLAQRVELVVDPQMEAAYPKHYGARVEINLANGERRASMVMDPHGMPGDPCTDAERVEKFSRLASRVKSPEAVAGIIRKVTSAESLSSVHELTALLRE
jgi:2-methylcitrate dehydratase PrpD